MTLESRNAKVGIVVGGFGGLARAARGAPIQQDPNLANVRRDRAPTRRRDQPPVNCAGASASRPTEG